MTSVLWFRRDLRLRDNPALLAAAGDGPVLPVFNPVTQGRRFDPSGDHVRRYVPELRGVHGAAVHEPWALPGGVPAGYPEPIVDHGAERMEALARYERVRR